MNNKQTTSARKVQKFEASGVTNLSVETNSGVFYLLARVAGKFHKESLKTTSKTAAKELLTKRLAELKGAAEKGLDVRSDLTVRTCAEAWFEEQKSLQAAGNLTANYIESLKYAFVRLWKVYPTEFGDTAVRKVTVEALKNPFLKFLKTAGSATAVNSTRRCLVGIWEVAIERKVLTENLAENLPNKVKKDKVKEVPNDEQLVALLNHITRKDSPNRFKDDIRDFIEFLCWTGARANEAANVLVSDVTLDGAAPQIHLRICKGSGGDESRARFVPIIPGARHLIANLCSGKKPGDALLNVAECLKTLEHSCAALELPKYTHHTFRHVFTTRALEATGCDYFTVANWLGHTDGGKLLAVLYAHLNTKHSQAQAAKVNFAFNPVKASAALGVSVPVIINGVAYTHQELAALLPKAANNVVRLAKAA